MPHAVLVGAQRFPEIGSVPILREGGRIHKVVETLGNESCRVMKAVVIEKGAMERFLVRLERRPDGMVVRLDDFMHAKRTPAAFATLARIAQLVLDANPDATVGATNLAGLQRAHWGAAPGKPS